MKEYYNILLGQILQGEHQKLKSIIDDRMEEGYEFEGRVIYSFESLRIHEAVEFLKDNYEYLRGFIQ